MTDHYISRVSPFGRPRVKACLAAIRGLSQLATPFVACPRQGIPRMLLVAYPSFSSRVYHLRAYAYKIYLFTISKSARRARDIVALYLRVYENFQPMELIGIEPTASALQKRRSPN